MMNFRTPPRSCCLLLLGILACAIPTGCTLLAVGAVGAAGAKAVSVTADRRTAGTQLDDFNAQNEAQGLIGDDEHLNKNANIKVSIYNRVALITGQAPSQADIAKAESIVANIKYVNKIHNQLRSGSPIPTSSAVYDSWLATKIRTKILSSDEVPTAQVSIIVEDSEVFLMGLVTNQEATAAVEIARHIEGVTKVVRAFEIYH